VGVAGAAQALISTPVTTRRLNSFKSMFLLFMKFSPS
jgi:hypothetical protein